MIWLLTTILFDTLSKPPIFVDFKCASKATFAILFMLLLKNLDPHSGFISARIRASSKYQHERLWIRSVVRLITHTWVMWRDWYMLRHGSFTGLAGMTYMWDMPYSHTRTHARTHAHTHVHTHAHARTCTDAQTHSLSLSVYYIHIYTLTHARTHTYTRSQDFQECFTWRGGGLGSSTIFKKFNEPYAPS